MSFFKSLLLVIIATVLLTYFLGASFLEFFGIDGATGINAKENILASLQAISVSALITLLLIAVGIAVILSVFGSIFFVVLLVLGAVFMLMLSAFWPILLMAFVIWLMVRDNNKAAYT